MSATTTQTIPLIACPACGDRIELHTSYDVHLGDIEPSVNAKVSKATATLTITGARVHHECPTISACAPTLVPAYVDVRPPVRPQATGGFIPPTLPAGDLLARED